MPVYSYLQLLFFISELTLLLLKRSKKATAKNNSDRRSLLVLWIVIVFSLCAGPFCAGHTAWWASNGQAVMYIGISVYIIGFVIRWCAIMQLGKMFTVDVAITDGHALKTNGLYTIVRHPSYLGLILIIAGSGIYLNSISSFIIMVMPVFFGINYRITVEEQALTQEFGDSYRDYQKKVKKIIPFIY